jgi:hypothetical protein
VLSTLATPESRRRGLDTHNAAMAAGQTLTHVPLKRSPDGRSWLRLTPQYVNRTLIEVICRP